MIRPIFLLTDRAGLGNLNAPNHTRRRKCLSGLPFAGKNLAAFSAAVEASAVYGGLLSHIGRAATSGIREDRRLRMGRGALLPCLFHFPNHTRYLMQAYVESIPRSLRHTNDNDAVWQAETLAHFLQVSLTGTLQQIDNDVTPDAVHGMSLVFDLLRDKLHIAQGLLDFPTVHHDKTAPVLWPPHNSKEDRQ